jgi:hypothetical protein
MEFLALLNTKAISYESIDGLQCYVVSPYARPQTILFNDYVLITPFYDPSLFTHSLQYREKIIFEIIVIARRRIR